jgi:hypothetical protein
MRGGSLAVMSKESKRRWAWWLMPIFLATSEAEIGRISV